MVDARDIRWDRGSIEEIRRWFEAPQEEEATQDSSKLDYPWPISIVSQSLEWGSSTEATTNVTLGFDDVPGAQDYETRMSVLKGGTALTLPAITTWPLNGSGFVSGTGIVLTQNTYGQNTSVICPITTGTGWSEINLSFTMYQPTSTADGFAVGIIDSAYYTTSYIGDGGADVGFYIGPISGSASIDNTIKHYCVYDESVYVATGNEGPTLRWNDGTTKAYSGIPNAGWNPAGTHTYTINFMRTGQSRATGTVTWDSTTILHVTNMWVPDDSYVIVSAATGAAYNLHQIDNFFGAVTY